MSVELSASLVGLQDALHIISAVVRSAFTLTRYDSV